MLGLFEIRHEEADPHGGAFRQKRLQGIPRAVEFPRLESRPGDGQPPFGGALREAGQGFGPLEAVERGIALTKIEIDLREIRMRLKPPRGFDDFGCATKIALPRQQPPCKRRRGLKPGRELDRILRDRQRAIGIVLDRYVFGDPGS